MADVAPKRAEPVTADAITAFTFKWDRWLGSGRTLSSVAVTCTPAGPVIGTPVLSNTDTYATVDVSGCAKGTHYILNCLATASDGRKEEARLMFYCRDDGET